MLVRPGPRHEHDVPLLTLQLLVDRTGLRLHATVVQVAHVGPRKQVTGLLESPHDLDAAGEPGGRSGTKLGLVPLRLRTTLPWSRIPELARRSLSRDSRIGGGA